MLMRLILSLLTWWNGSTIGTRFTLWRDKGELVGEDQFGNTYHRIRLKTENPAFGKERRFVVYNGVAEASTIPPGWWGWMHFTVDVPPSAETYTPRDWQKPHRQNFTGTPRAWRPPGSTLAEGRRPAATGDYKPWTPAE